MRGIRRRNILSSIRIEERGMVFAFRSFGGVSLGKLY